MKDYIKVVRVVVKAESAKCSRCKEKLKQGTIADLLISKSIFWSEDDQVVDKEIFHPDCLDNVFANTVED